MPAGLAVGALFAMVWTILGALSVAKLIDSEVIPETAVGYGSGLILLTASLGAALVSFSRIKHQRALVCMAAGGIYFLMLLAVTALFFGGQYTGIGVTALLIAAGSGTAVLMGMSGRGGKRRSAYKKRVT